MRKDKVWRSLIKKFAVECFGGKCEHCGIIDDYRLYEFHHLDETKKESAICTIIDNSGKKRAHEKLLTELPKCACLCPNCHRKVHFGSIQLVENIDRFDIEKFKTYLN